MMERSKEGTGQDEEVKLGTDHPWLRQQCMSRAGRNVPSSYTALQLMVLPMYCIVKAPTLGLGKILKACIFFSFFGTDFFS